MPETFRPPLAPAAQGGLLLASFVMLRWQEMPSAVRPCFVIVYLLVIPGYALLPALARHQWLLRFLLALAIGTALAIGLSTLMSETGSWDVAGAVRLTIALVVGSVLVRARPGTATSSILRARRKP